MTRKPIAALLAAGLAVWLGAGARIGRADAPATAAMPTVQEAFRAVIMADRKTGPLNPQPITQADFSKDVRKETVRITPEEGQDAVVAIYRPKAEGKYPTVIVQHFLGGSKDHFALIPLLGGLAQKGFLVAAIDGRYRGERQHGKSLDVAMLEALRTGKGHPFLFDTAYDLTRLIDYLQTRPDVDANRIGMTGISEGGILTWMTAAIDPRIKVAAPVIGVTCFADAVTEQDTPEGQERVKLFGPLLNTYAMDLGEKQCNCKVLCQAWRKLCPGMLDRFDATNVVPTIAPRPLLVISHEKDELFPVAGAKKVDQLCEQRYAQLNAADHFSFRVDPGLKHAPTNIADFFTDVTATESWLEKWLKS